MPAPSVELVPPRLLSEPRAPLPGAIRHRSEQECVRLCDGRTRGWGLSYLGADCLQRLVSAPELLLAGARTWLKDQPGHRVALVDSESEMAPGIWCCKETTTHSWWVRWVTTWGSFRAQNAFRQGLCLLRAQIQTPQPLAVMAVTRRGTYHEYLLTEAIPDAISLQRWLSAPGPSHSGERFRRRCDITRQWGQQLQRLHQHGFDHRDLKATNILLSEPSGGCSVWLIDLDGVWRWPWLPSPRRVQNLARLWAGVALIPNVSATDALRLLFAYLTPEQRRGWKSLWRQIVRRSAAKISRQRALDSV